MKNWKSTRKKAGPQLSTRARRKKGSLDVLNSNMKTPTLSSTFCNKCVTILLEAGDPEEFGAVPMLGGEARADGVVGVRHGLDPPSAQMRVRFPRDITRLPRLQMNQVQQEKEKKPLIHGAGRPLKGRLQKPARRG